ncbi:MAG TPA: oligoendopeptidase F [Bacillota bacterium]|nr:oligoendopeptidase F [Peptococcaceae bacterium MAG4]NLW37292.1 oligoendopeptidase F [Peptococcaceae bacterium]HPZ44084.1 oligoendopeptidase F [Bacillota bacterium]HQD76594.1 oligoendopeptidase F [Bacillota bacterium]HUM59302.1 oligoendopeptidase F [Bacillota bacterium]
MNGKGSLPGRYEIPDKFKWRLEDIYPSDKDWEKDFQRVHAMISEVEAFRGKLGLSARTLLEALELDARLRELNEKVFVYARMRRDEDNTNPVYQALTDRAESLSARVQAALSFLAPEILALPEEVLERFRREESGLALYDFLLEELRRQKEHVLSPSEERIIALAGEAIQAQDSIFRMINNADISFPKILDETGNEVEITHGRYTRLLESSDRRVRKDAFEAFYSSYRRLKNTIAATLSSSVKRDIFYARVRKHPSALQASLFEDNIPPEVYDNLIQTVRNHLGLMHRYTALRKRLLGLDELHMYDLYVPLVKDISWEINYPEAVDMIREGLSPLGRSYVETMSKGLESGWIDLYESRGKSSGAYSWGPYGVHPYVLMNYQNNLSNVFTLAHELGHAMHSYYSFTEQPYIYAHYKIFTAEVASTVNESLLMDYLLKTVGERDKQLYLLNHYLEQFRGTLFRQTMFAEFEKIIHERAEAGEALTPDSLCELYYRLNVDYHGPAVFVDQDIALEWARIPHFYSAFYVYKYATGFSAATAITRLILNQGEPALGNYITFLKKGGSDYPLKLLKTAGVDLSTPRPVQEALQLFGQLLDRLEELTG